MARSVIGDVVRDVLLVEDLSFDRPPLDTQRVCQTLHSICRKGGAHGSPRDASTLRHQGIHLLSDGPRPHPHNRLPSPHQSCDDHHV